jgi:hypothetical protein
LPSSGRKCQYKTCTLNDAHLIFSITGYDSFNEDEKSYINFDCWIRDVIVSSLKSYEANQELSVQQTSKFFKDVEEFPLDLCLSVSTGCRPHPWIDMLAIFAIENLLGQLTDKCQEDQIKMKSFAFVRPLV